MVVAAEAEAARAGLAVLEAGGNAMDAGVCVGFTLAVTLPRAGNLGGGGFLLYHDAANGQVHALDYREVAPRAAYRDLFLDESGRADPEKSRFSPLAVGVPGTVDGLLEAHRRFGTLPLAELLEPAIRLAEGGFRVGPELAASLAQAHRTQRLSPAARLVYFRPDGTPLEAGDWLRQGDLAASLRRIAADGRDGFYTGPTAEAIVETLGRDGGLLTIDDLRRYTPVWREPVQGTYREHTVYSMPPPSSGGVHLVQMLQVLEAFPLADWGPNSQRAVHHMAEAMKRAYADRSRHLGDPDFHPVPVAKLLSEAYTGRVQARIDPEHPTPSERIEPGELRQPGESPETTHFSIVDGQGNALSNTYTLNFSYGSGILAEGTGILLNNEMDDFSAQPGVPNAYGLIGGEANAVEPGKRMLSSMTPTLVLKDGTVRLVTGSPGGSRIITTVLQVVVNVLDHGMNAAEAVTSPRFHHQWLPDVLEVERGFPADTVRLLREAGYRVESSGTLGGAQTVLMENGSPTGAADPRRPGSTVAGN